MKDLIKLIRIFNKERDWNQYHNPKNLSMALMIETGELAENFLWLSQDESKHLDKDTLDKVKEEIGDIMIYLLNISDKLGIDAYEAAKEKIELNASKYPADRSKGKAIKYTKL